MIRYIERLESRRLLAGVPRPDHVVIVVEENHGYADVIGNAAAPYINALAAMTGLEIEPTPPATATDMLAAIVETVLAGHAEGGDVALLLDSQLEVEGEDCSMSFVLVPDQGGVDLLLERLGMA